MEALHMNFFIISVFAIGFIIRISVVSISTKHEKMLKNNGALEYGKINSIILGILHFLFYIAAFSEGLINKTKFDNITIVGIVIYAFSLFMLFVVINQLNNLWTTKIMLAKEHKLNQNLLFKTFRHPNYFLNLIPELISLTLILKSYRVFIWMFPLYLISLITRIIQEEKVMKNRFINYLSK